ncbi:hypothetical protein [Nocardia sp. NPDC004415]
MAETPVFENIPSDGSADDMLDIGAEGLQYFVQYLPRYQNAVKYTRIASGYKPELIDADMDKLIYARYDTERGMDIEAIDRMSSALTKVMSKLPGEIDEQRRQLSALPTIWQGQAGDAAFNMLNAQVTRAEQDRIDAATVSLELSYVAIALRNAVRHKAVTVQSFWASNMPDIPQQDGNGLGRTAIDSLIDSVRYYDDEVAKEWLTKTFIPHVDATYDKFVQLCKEVDTEVRRVYGVLVEALNGLDTAAYPMPQEASKPQTVKPTGETPSGETPSGGTPSTDTPSTDTSTKPATTTDDDDDKDDDKNDDDKDDDDTDITDIADTISDVVSDLTSLVSSVSQLESLVTTTAETLSAGLTSLGTTIQEGFDSLSSQLSSLMSGGATFDVNGTQVSIGTDADGQLTMTTTDANGTTHEYGVKLDENGVPVVTDDQTTGDIGTGTPETGTGQGPAGLDEGDGGTSSETTANPTGSLNAKGTAAEHAPNQPWGGSAVSSEDEADGEHWSGDYPAVPQVDPGDSGAELAEAGPL